MTPSHPHSCGSIDAAGIRAESKDGVITAHVPKTKVEARKPKEIKIQ